jgi:hypothetical protein
VASPEQSGDVWHVAKVLATVLVCAAAVAAVAPGSVAAPASGSVQLVKSGVRKAHRAKPKPHCQRQTTRRRSGHGRRARQLNRARCVSRTKAKKLSARTAAVKRPPRPARKPSGSQTASRPPASSTPAPAAGSSTPTSPGPSSSGPTTGSTWTAQPHVETWAYDDCGNGGSSTATALVRQWVTYAEANCGPGGDAKTLSDCHSASTTFCNVIQYLDTNWIFPNGSPPWGPFSAAASESWYQHTPGSQTTRIMSSGYGGGYLINQSDPAVKSFFQSYVRNHYGAEDGLMMDDQSTSLSTQLYYSTCGCSSSNEVSSTPALRSAHEAMSAAMTHATGQPYIQIDNSLPANPYLPQGFDMLDRQAGVTGFVKEGSPEYNGTLDPYYSTLLDEIAYVASTPTGFVVPLSYGSAGASYQQQSRRVQEATMLVGYSPGHLADWADLEQGSNNLAVWPEEGIYPTAPLQSMGAPGGNGCLGGTGDVCSTGGHNDVQVVPGVYRREFGACYNHGVLFGACATIINTTASSVTIRSSWLTRSYGHQITFSGGDVQSGGAINLAGATVTPDSSTVGAHDAVLLAP